MRYVSYIRIHGGCLRCATETKLPRIFVDSALWEHSSIKPCVSLVHLSSSPGELADRTPTVFQGEMNEAGGTLLLAVLKDTTDLCPSITSQSTHSVTFSSEGRKWKAGHGGEAATLNVSVCACPYIHMSTHTYTMTSVVAKGRGQLQRSIIILFPQ